MKIVLGQIYFFFLKVIEAILILDERLTPLGYQFYKDLGSASSGGPSRHAET